MTAKIGAPSRAKRFDPNILPPKAAASYSSKSEGLAHLGPPDLLGAACIHEEEEAAVGLPGLMARGHHVLDGLARAGAGTGDASRGGG